MLKPLDIILDNLLTELLFYLLYFWGFFCMFSCTVPLSWVAGMLSFCHSFSSLLFSSYCINFSLWLARVRGAIVCLRLVYEEHWFTQWGLACSYREGEKYEWIYNTPILHFYPLFPNSPIIFLPRYTLLSHLQSHFSTGVYVWQWECICVKPEGRPTLARGSFLWPSQCVSRRLAGVSGASSSFQLQFFTLGPLESPCNEPLLSHF